MAKFHINKHGVPAPCKAKPGNCPLGGDETHFNSLEEAQVAADKMNEEKHGLLSEMREKKWIKQESDAETYLINDTYYKVVWGYSTGNDTGPHNQFDTDVCIFKWVGEPCTLDELPKVFGNDWEPIEGFDLETIENSYGNLEVDWEDYAKKVDEILAEIEEEQTKENSLEEAQVAADKMNEEKHGLLSEMREKTKENMKKMANEELLQITIANARSVGTGYNEEIEEFIRIAKEELLERMSK